MQNHPEINSDRGSCDNCGLPRLKISAYKVTKKGKFVYYYCQNCGNYPKGVKINEKV